MSESTVDPQHPWPGLASFTEETRAYFHGREDEVNELARRVQRKLLTILFGQSGLGKTSILRAGIVPRLRREGLCPVYVRIDYAPESPSPSEQIKQAILRATASSGRWTKPGTAVEGESLWEFLHHRDDVLMDDAGNAVTPLLIFDQFEEIFTLAQGDDAGRQRVAQFIDDLADLVENRLPKALEAKLDDDESIIERFDLTRGDYRVLIALREDYLAHLEGLKGPMPSITQNRMRLARMNGAQALDAVRKPGGALVNEEVAEAIVRFIAGGSELRNAEVEPSLLSLICRELNNTRIAQDRPEISADLLAGSRETILSEFYERALADQPPGVRKFIEDEMLTESGFRESLAEERVAKAFAAAGAAPEALATLVNRRLLRIEDRLDLRRVELTHDVLCGVVSASRELRHEREALEEAEKQLAAQKAREAATRKALVRARQIAAGCAVLAVFAVVAAGFGIWGMQHAQATRAMAETARAESERLIVYLLDDFQRELEPVGRLDIVGELARRAIDYYQALPAELRTPETERNRALAQVRYGLVLRNQGKLTEARAALDAAVPTLDDLRAKGDAGEATAIGLALGLIAQARLLDARGRDSETIGPATRAVAVVEPGTKAADASIALRRTYAAALTQLGFLQQRRDNNEAAIESLEAARAMYRSIDNLLTDGDAIANFAITTAWLIDALNRLGRPDDAGRAGDEARAAASQLLERHPTHMLALRARALVSASLARVALNELQPARRVASADDSARDWALLARIDPSNMITKANFIVGRQNAAEGLWDLGRPGDSAAKFLDNREVEAAAAASTLVSFNLYSSYAGAALVTAERGQTANADKLFADAMRYFETYIRSTRQGTFDSDIWRAGVMVNQVELATAMGDPVRARAAAKGVREIQPKPQPGDAFEQLRVALNLRRLHLALGWAELQAGDMAAAQVQFRHVAEASKQLPTLELSNRREAADDAALLAITLAYSGRLDEARDLAVPVLAFQRELHARKTEDQWHKIGLALALLAVAQSTPDKSGALLAEAQATLDSLPAEARSVRTSQTLRGLIAEARAGR